MFLQNRYHLVRLIGQGGLGKTFLALDEGQSPPVLCAIKQLLPHNQLTLETENFAFLQKQSLALFQQQAQRLEELGKHPQIPSLLAHFEQDGCMYLVHEFIDGTNLARVLEEEGTFNEAQIWQLLADLLPVLKFIHDRQVIHGDIKPENIIRPTPPNPPLSRGGKDSFPPPNQSGNTQGFSPPYQGGVGGGQLVLVDFGTAQFVEVGAIHEWPLHTGTGIGSPEYVSPEQARGKAVFASDLYSLGVTCIYLLTHIPPFDLFDAANDCWTWRQYAIGEVSDRLCQILDKLLQNAVNRRFQSADAVLEQLKSWGRFKVANYNIQPINLPMCEPSNPSWQCIHTLSVNSGLPKSVNSVAMSSDSRLLASGGDDKIIRLWNPDTGQAIGTLCGHSHAVNCVAFCQGTDTQSPPVLASASDDKTVKLWNYETGQEILTLTGHSHVVKSVAFHPNGLILASGSWDKTVKLWDVKTGVELCTLTGHKLQVSAISLSPNGHLLASASFDRTVRLYSLPYLKHCEFNLVQTLQATSLHCTLVGHCGHVFAAAFSPDGKTIATASDDNTVKLWDINTGQTIRTLVGHSWSVVAVTFSSDGETLISGSWDKTVKLWKASTGEQICTLAEHADSVRAVTISSTNQLIASCSQDKTLKVWQKQ